MLPGSSSRSVKFDVPTSAVYRECFVGKRVIGYNRNKIEELQVWLMMGFGVVMEGRNFSQDCKQAGLGKAVGGRAKSDVAFPYLICHTR